MATSSFSAGRPSLTGQLLHCLRADRANTTAPDVDDPAELGAASSYGAEHILAALLLGTALSPHFTSLDDLANTTSFIAIEVRSTADAYLFGRILMAALPYSGVTVDPQYRLGLDDTYPVFIGSGSRLDERLRLVAEAARRCLPAIWLYHPEAGVPTAFTTIADVLVGASTPTHDMLAATFTEFFGRTPTNLGELTHPGTLGASELALHVRPGRSPEACVDSLRALMPAAVAEAVVRPKLQDQPGYGEARMWGLELSADFALWGRGQLAWEEVDHRSVLLAGLPGTGKTTFAGLLAGTLDVPLVASSVAEWNAHENLSGTLKRMRAVFEEAMDKAPCVLLVDELDGISSRQNISGRYTEYWTQIVNLMLELVTRAMATPGLVIVGATNFVERIDPALTRSGRLDHTIIISPPDPAEIAAILAHYIGSHIGEGELRGLARQLAGKTGADIERLVRTARANARRQGHPFSIADLQEQVSGAFEKLPPELRRRLATYRAGQAVVARALGLVDLASEDVVDFGQILVRSLDKGSIPTEHHYDDAIAVLLAGRAAEEILLGGVSVLGVGSTDSDLALATALARQLETRSGLGEAGLIDLEDPVLQGILPTSIIGSVRRRLDAGIIRASAIVLEHRAEVEVIVAAMVRGPGLMSLKSPKPVLH